jgi:hypothetical protein
MCCRVVLRQQGHGLFCPTPASQAADDVEASLEWLPINANLDYFRSVEPYRRGRWEVRQCLLCTAGRSVCFNSFA